MLHCSVFLAVWGCLPPVHPPQCTLAPVLCTSVVLLAALGHIRMRQAVQLPTSSWAADCPADT